MSRYLLVNLIALLLPATACADDLSFPHEEREPSWKVETDSRAIRVSRHIRQTNEAIQGRAAEQITLRTLAKSNDFQLIHPIPRAQPIEDLEATLSFRCDRIYGRLCLRLVLPQQKDPLSEGPLTILIPGESSSEHSRWQTIRCRLDKTEGNRALQFARARLRLRELNTSGMYVDAVVCRGTIANGETSIWLDDLQIRGLIPLPQEQQSRVEPAGHAQVSGPRKEEFPVQMKLDRLYVHDRPRFPLILPHHGESTGFLQQLGVNTVWFPDATDHLLASQFIEQGLMPMATPPRPTNAEGRPLDAREVSLAPFNERSDSIYFWYMGTNIPFSAADELVSWRTQVSNADRRTHRPILADVEDKEDFFSHYVDMVASSRSVAFTGESYHDYRDWLIAKQRRSPGSFFWTWIDLDSGLTAGPCLEPEQLRLQVYAALSAGCRGLGFWTSRALDQDDVESTEMRLTIAELNREIQMLEPFLATGTLIGTTPVTVEGEANGAAGSSSRVARQSLTPQATVRDKDAMDHDGPGDQAIEAAMIGCDAGMLLLPVWYDSRAGYVPGQMATRNVKIIVPGSAESSSAWLITPTGIVALDSELGRGGKHITLPAFSETAAILLTTDTDLIRRLQAQTSQFIRASAMDSVLIAKSKWERVKTIDHQLTQLGRPQEAAEAILKSSERLLQQAENEIAQKKFRSARNDAGTVMQLLRILQRQHWEATVETIPQVTTSPYTTSFQQLPHHWRLVKRIGRRDEYAIQSRLASGDFEDVNGMVRDGWQHMQVDVEDIRSTAELYPESPPDSDGEYCLRLVSSVADPMHPPALISHKTVQVSTPPVDVNTGDIVYVTGWVRVRFPSPDRLDHAVIYDSIQHSSGELRFDGNPNWHRFELLRLADRDEPFQVHFALEGLGEMQIDDVQVVTLQPRSPADPESAPPRGEPSFRDRARDLFNRIPGVDRFPNIPTIPSIPGFEQN